MDDETVEEMIADCVEVLDHDEERFSKWESQFIEELAEREDYTHLSPKQQDKLAQIWEEHDCGAG